MPMIADHGQRAAGVRPLHAHPRGRLRAVPPAGARPRRRPGQARRRVLRRRRCSRRSGCPSGCPPTDTPAAADLTLMAPLDHAVELLDRALGYTRACLAEVTAPTCRRRTPCDGWDLGQLLAHMEDALDAFTEGARGEVDLARPRCPSGSGSTASSRRPARCSAPGAARRPATCASATTTSTTPVVVARRRARDHRARLGRRPGHRRRPRRSRRARRAVCSRSPRRCSPSPTAAPSSARHARSRPTHLRTPGCSASSAAMPTRYGVTRIAAANYRHCRYRRGRRFLAFVHARAGRPRRRPGSRRRPAGCGVRSGARRRHRRGALRPRHCSSDACGRGACSATAERALLAPRCSSAGSPAASWPRRWRSATASAEFLERARADPAPSRTTPAASWPRRSATPSSRWSTSWPSASETADDQVAPDLLPWRAGAALATVRRGRRREAAELRGAPSRRGAARPGRRTPSRSRCAPWPPTDAGGPARGAAPRRRGRRSTACRADRLLAQIDTDLAGAAGARRRRGDAAEALALLRGAEAYAGRQELWPLQGRVRRLLDRLGEAPRPDRQRGAGLADRGRAAGRGARRRRAHQPADRRAARGDRQGGRVAPLARLPQARRSARARRSRRRSAPPPDLRSLDSAPWPSAPRTPSLPMGGRDPARGAAGPPPRWSCSST